MQIEMSTPAAFEAMYESRSIQTWRDINNVGLHECRSGEAYGNIRDGWRFDTVDLIYGRDGPFRGARYCAGKPIRIRAWGALLKDGERVSTWTYKLTKKARLFYE
jgi:hypothetical protein